MITIEFTGEDGVWAPCSSDAFFDRSEGVWTPERVRAWFAESAPPPRGLGKLLGPPMPMSLSTALPGSAMRYIVRGGLLFPRWAVFSVVDRETLDGCCPPVECRLDVTEDAIFLRFEHPGPVPLSEPLGLIRCVKRNDEFHCYADPANRFGREPERFVPASDGADGHV
jgi:hypothetical protein